MSQPCTNCANLQAALRLAQDEIRRLQIENQILHQIIQRAKSTCLFIVNCTNKLLSQHQPRGVWAFAKGARQAARIIARYLG